MKRILIYAVIGLLTALGVTFLIWTKYRKHVGATLGGSVSIKIPNERDDAIELAFRNLIQRYPSHPVYFLSFAETDPSEEFMNRFAGDPRIKRFSQARRNANQVIDAESGVIGVHVQAGTYYPINEDEVKVGAVWELVQPQGNDPGWTLWSIEYQLRRVNGKWTIASSKIRPPLT